MDFSEYVSAAMPEGAEGLRRFLRAIEQGVKPEKGLVLIGTAGKSTVASILSDYADVNEGEIVSFPLMFGLQENLVPFASLVRSPRCKIGLVLLHLGEPDASEFDPEAFDLVTITRLDPSPRIADLDFSVFAVDRFVDQDAEA